MRLGSLAVANIAFAAANVVHGIDHERTGTGRLTPEVFWGGGLLTVTAFAALWFTLRRHPRAPLLAALVGITAAFAVASAHLAPHWGVFSDSYWDLRPDAFSWAAALAEIATALVFGLVGIRELRRERTVAAVPA